MAKVTNDQLKSILSQALSDMGKQKQGQAQASVPLSAQPKAAQPKAARGLTWDDYNRYEQDYNIWQQTGQHGADFNSWATQDGLDAWRQIRDRGRNRSQSALIGDRYLTMDKDTYDRYERDYRTWERTGQHGKDFDSWATDDDLETWRQIRDYNTGVKNGTNPSMELQGFINGLDPDALTALQEAYKASWTYGKTDEDLARQAEGKMPVGKDKYYKKGGEIDQWLYSQGLPSTQGEYFQRMYESALANVQEQRKNQPAYDFSSTPENQQLGKTLADYWKSTWTYSNSAEDKKRKAAGKIPEALEKEYTSTKLDQYYKELGLPPASRIDEIAGGYDAQVGSYNELVQEYMRRKSSAPWESAQEILSSIMRDDTEGIYRDAFGLMESEPDLSALEGDKLLSAYLGGGKEKGTKNPMAFKASDLDAMYDQAFSQWFQEENGTEYQKGMRLADYVTRSTGDSLADKTFDFRTGAESADYADLDRRIAMIDAVRAEIAPLDMDSWKEQNPEADSLPADAAVVEYQKYVDAWKNEHPNEDNDRLDKNLQEQRKYLAKLRKKAAKTEKKAVSAEEEARKDEQRGFLKDLWGASDAFIKAWKDGKTSTAVDAEMQKLTGEGSVYKKTLSALTKERDAIVQADNDPNSERNQTIAARTAELASSSAAQMAEQERAAIAERYRNSEEWEPLVQLAEKRKQQGWTRDELDDDFRGGLQQAVLDYVYGADENGAPVPSAIDTQIAERWARKQAEAENPSDAEYAKAAVQAWANIFDPFQRMANDSDAPAMETGAIENEYTALAYYVTNDQMQEFARIAQEDGAVAAGKYWQDTVRPEAEKRMREAQQAENAVEAYASPVGASMKSAALTIPAGVTGIRSEIAALRGDYRPNDWRGYIGREKGDLQQYVSNEIAQNNGQLLSFAFNTGMSMVESLQTMALGDAGLVLTGFRAAGDTVDEVINRGGSSREAGVLGLISGITEYATEKMNMDRLLEMKASGTFGDFLKSILITEGGSEALEEGVSETVDILADVFLRADESEFVQQMQEYERNGMSQGDAFWKTLWTQAAVPIGSAMAGGYLSGILMGAGFGTYNTGRVASQSGYKWYQFQKGNEILTNYQNALERGKVFTGSMNRIYSDIRNSGLSAIERYEAAIVFQQAAQMPLEYTAEEVQQSVTDLQTALQKSAEQNSIYTAESEEARVKAQNRLNGLLSDIQQAYTAAGQALQSGNLEAQAQFLNQMYDGIDKYNREYTESGAALRTQQAKAEAKAAEANRQTVAAIQKATFDLKQAGDNMAKTLLTQAAVIVDAKGNAVQVDDSTLAAIRSGNIDINDLIQRSGQQANLDITRRMMGVQTPVGKLSKLPRNRALKVLQNEYGNRRLAMQNAYDAAMKSGDVEAARNALEEMNDLQKQYEDAMQKIISGESTMEKKPSSEQLRSELGSVFGKESDQAAKGEKVPDKVTELNDGAKERAKKYHVGLNTAGFDLKKQSKSFRMQARVVDSLGKRTGIKFVLHEQLTDSRGMPANAMKDSAGVIHLNMSLVGDGLLYYATHEVVHKVKAFSQVGYELMRDMVKDSVFRGELWEEALEKTAALYGFDLNTEEGRADAEEELVCDRMPVVFADRAFVADLVNRDASLGRRIMNWLNRAERNIRNSVIDAARNEDDYVREYVNDLLREKTDNLIKMADTLSYALDMMEMKNGHTEAAKYVDGDIDGDVKLNLETMDRDLEKFIDAIAKADIPGFTDDDLKDIRKGVNKIMDIVRKHTDILDYDAPTGKNRPWTPVKGNSDKHYKIAIDFSTLCKKRILTQMIIEKLQSELKRAVTDVEQMAIRERLKDMQKQLTHIQVACGLCYVESARLKNHRVINQFLNDIPKAVDTYYAKRNKNATAEIKQRHDELLKKYAKDGKTPKNKRQLPPKGQDEWAQINQEVWKKYAAPAEVIEKAKSLPKETFLTAKSLADLAVTDSEIYHAFIEKVTQATRSKNVETDMPFEFGDSASITDNLIDEMNRESGLRHQSWSDFQFMHVLDTMAMIMELSTRNAQMHAYTKVAEMAHVVGKTGIMLNLSLIPGGESGLNPDGTLMWDDVEGMAWDTMMHLRDMYPETVGNIAIGITDDQIRALMQNDDVDYIIPYHASGLNKAMRELIGLHGWNSYQQVQNEKRFKDTGKEAPSLEDWYDEDEAKKAKDGRAYMIAASERYLQKCYENGYEPKFSRFLQKDKNVEHLYHLPDDHSADGYWKMLIDRKMINQKTGKIIVQKAVRPNFDYNKIAALMQADVLNPVHKQNQTAIDTILDEMRRGELPISDETKREIAYKNAQGLLRSYEAVERMKEKGMSGDLIDAVLNKDKTKASLAKTRENDSVDAVMNPEGDEKYSLEKGGNGYDGYSMSNNARAAYENGEKPISRWTKADIISAVAEQDAEKAKLLEKVPVDALKNHLLYQSSWHHTSSMYNRTDFYSLDLDRAKAATAEQIADWAKEKTERPETERDHGTFHYVEWGGTRNYPKATNRTITDAYVEKRGSFYYVYDADGNELVKKKVGSNGTRFESDAEMERRREAEEKLKAQQEEKDRLLRENSSAAAIEWYDKEKFKETSREGNIYKYGEKPHSYEYDMPNFLRGRQRLHPKGDGGYELQRHDGEKWVSDEAENGVRYSSGAPDDKYSLHRVLSSKDAESLYTKGYNEEVIRKDGASYSLSKRTPAQAEYRIRQLEQSNERLRNENAEERARRREQLRAARERNEVEKRREKVTERSKQLLDWLKMPNKKEHVPIPLQGYLAGILENLNLNISEGGSKDSRAFLEAVRGLKDYYSAYVAGARNRYDFEGFESTVPGPVIEALQTIEDGTVGMPRIGTMNAEQLKALQTVLGTVRKDIVFANKLMSVKRYGTVDELGRQTQTDAMSRKERNIWKLKSLQDLLSTRMMDAFSWGKAAGKGAEAVVDALERGMEKSYGRIREGVAWLNGVKKELGVSRKDMRSWTKETKEIQISNGKKVTLTGTQMMELYALSKRPQALAHILTGGIEIQDMQNGHRQTNIYQMTDVDVQAVIEQLTQKQKDLVDAMQNYLSTDVAEWGNEVWRQLYDYEMFGEENYWPIRSAARGVKTQDPEAQRTINAMLNMGMTKALVPNANNPVTIGDAFDTFTGHVSQMARLNGLGAPIDDALKWFNWIGRDELGTRDFNATTKGAIDKLLGPEGSRYFLKLLKDINGLSTGDAGTQLASELMSKYKRAAVAGKLRVVVQQPTAILRAFAVIDPKYFATDYVGNIKKNVAEMQEHSPLAWWKSQGNYDIGTGKSMRSIFFESDNLVDDITNAAMTPAGWADDFAWGWLWSAVKNETAATHPELKKGSDAYWEHVNERFSQIVNETQVVDGILQRSDLMRSKNGLDQMASAFMAEPTKSYNLIRNRIMALAAGGGKKAAKELFRALVALAMSIAANSAVLALHDSARKMQRGDKFSKAFSDNFRTNALNDVLPWEYVPYIKDIASIMKGDDVERMDMSMIQDIYSAASNGYKYLTGQSSKTGYKVASDILSVAGAAAGIPTTGLLSTMETVVNGIHPGAIKKNAYLDKDKRAALKAAGIGYDEGYGIAAQYKTHDWADKSPSTNAEKGVYLLEAASRVGGRYTDEQYDVLSEVLGLNASSYDPQKNGSFGDWTRSTMDKYVADKEKEADSGKITEEKYEEIKKRYDKYYDLLAALGY